MKKIIFFLRRLLNTLLIMILPANFYQMIPDRFKDFYAVVRAYMLLRRGGIFFITLGACDGIYADPLRKYIVRYHWPGIMVEPVKYAFQQLVNNYKNSTRIHFENIAIDADRGIKDFYYLRGFEGDKKNETMKALGTFIYKNIEDCRQRFPDIEKFVVTEKVQTVTFDDLLKKYKVETVDLLMLDVEGYEFTIIKTLDFSTVKPRMIWYEYVHLDTDEREQCRELLKNNGYYFMRRGHDILAYLSLWSH